MTTSVPTTALDEAQARPRTPGEARLTLLRERGVFLANIARRLDLPVPDAFPELHRGQA